MKRLWHGWWPVGLGLAMGSAFGAWAFDSYQFDDVFDVLFASAIGFWFGARQSNTPEQSAPAK